MPFQAQLPILSLYSETLLCCHGSCHVLRVCTWRLETSFCCLLHQHCPKALLPSYASHGLCLPSTAPGGKWFSSHFTDEETEALRGPQCAKVSQPVSAESTRSGSELCFRILDALGSLPMWVSPHICVSLTVPRMIKDETTERTRGTAPSQPPPVCRQTMNRELLPVLTALCLPRDKSPGPC